MKSKTHKNKAALKATGGRKSLSEIVSSALRASGRHSAYAFVASLGVWLPKAEAATLINLNATPLPVGPLQTWTNSGTVVSNFTAVQVTNPPVVGFAAGIKSVEFTTVGGGNNGQSYIGPVAPVEITGAGARTVECWLVNPTVQGEESIIAWGARATPGPPIGTGPTGENWSFGHGSNGGADGGGFGAVAIWGGPDIGWANQEDANVLQYAVATYDGSTTRCYLDGVLVSSETVAINTKQFATNGVDLLRFRIGRQNNPNGGIDATGTPTLSVARLRVHDVALDATTITNNYTTELTEFIALATTDSDTDGIPNWYEELYGLNMGADDSGGDLDSDGSTNLQEYQRNTKANDSDTDDDGYLDGVETNTGVFVSTSDTGTNPLLLDTDGDTLRDGIETRTLVYVSPTNPGTSPVDRDTDDDLFMDQVEIARGSDPTQAASTPPTNAVVSLNAAGLPLGVLNTWTNLGTIGSNFTAQAGGGVVQTIQGVVSVNLPGPTTTGPYYNGPLPTTYLVGNSSYSIEAWIHNPTAAPEETVFAWGARNLTDPNGRNASFNHGLDDAFGAMGHWGGQDLGWGPDANVKQGIWTYVVYTYDAASGVQRCYSDGVEASNETIAALRINATGNGGQPLPFRIGSQSENNGTATANLRGTLAISELRVYEWPLQAATIAATYAAGQDKYGLVDYDNDGLPTWYERQYPVFLSETNAADAALDFDSDTLSNLGEYTNFTDPTKTDTDGDGLTDGNEFNTLNLNPTNPDTDYDGLNDGREVALSTQPLNGDSDADGFADSIEVLYGSDPTVVGSVPTTTPAQPVVKLDATALPTGPLTTWHSSNSLAYAFTALGNPTVAFANGAKGVTFDGDDSYVGPTMPQYFGGNANWTVEAWILNPAVAGEETVLAWGRRGGNPDGSNASFIHGTDLTFGAVGLWASSDVAWGTNAAQIAQNTTAVAGQWTHVAYTHDSTTSRVDLYRAGQFVHSESVTNAAGLPLNTHTIDPSDPRNPANFGRYLPFRIGAQSDAGGFVSGPQATMTIAKARIYNATLSAAEIAANYNAERVQFPQQPRITNVRVNPANGFVSFDWVPEPGRTYEVLRNTDVANPNGWTSIATGQNSGSFTNDPAGAPVNFYRLRVEP